MNSLKYLKIFQSNLSVKFTFKYHFFHYFFHPIEIMFLEGLISGFTACF